MSSTETQGNGNSAGFPSVSSDGRYVAFQSAATNLVSGDTNLKNDIFARDRVQGVTRRVSVDSQGAEANNHSSRPVMSADGRYVAFASTASNLIVGDTNGKDDVFVHDLSADVTVRVSESSSGAQANNTSFQQVISANGRFVAFTSQASNLVTPENANEDVFVRDRDSDGDGVFDEPGAVLTSRVSVGYPGGASGAGSNPSISADGSLVAFESSRTDIVLGDTNANPDVFVRDAAGGTTTRVSISDSEAEGNFGGSGAAISGDGRFVAFVSDSTNLVSDPDTNGSPDVFVRDRLEGRTLLVSVDTTGDEASQSSFVPSISGAGRYVAFNSGAPDIVSSDTNGFSDVFVRDLLVAATERVSVSSSGAQATGASDTKAISASGRYVAFHSSAANLVAGDTNSFSDIFLRDRGATVPLEQTYGAGRWHAENPTTFWADPINTATGSYAHTETDVSLPGTGVPFSVTRSYNSADPTSGPLGPGWTYTYTPSLTMEWDGDVVLRAEDGQQVTFTKQADGSFTSAPGGRSALTTSGGGYRLTRKDQVRYDFDAGGRLTAIKDRNAQGLTLAYGGDGRLATVTDAAGRDATFTHNGSGLLTGVSLEDGRGVSYGYTGGRLTSVTDVRGGTITYAYDAGGRLSEVKDQNGHFVVRNTYGADGRVTEQRDPLGNQSTLTWDVPSETATMTDARSGVWRDVYAGNVLQKRIDPLGGTTEFTYDADLNLVILTDPRGKVWSMTYDARGNLLTRTSPAPLSISETFVYNAKNDLTSYTNGRGKTTTYDYDAAGNLTQVTAPGAVVTESGRDPGGTGLLTSVTDPRSNVTTFAYDASGNLAKTTSPLGFETTMAYDAAGRVTSMVEPRGNVAGATPADFRWTYTYDAAGNLLTQSDPLGNQTSFAYDAVGNLTGRTDAKGRTTSYAYNAADELVSVAAPDAALTQYAYDAGGNLTTRTDAKAHQTTYAYDLARRLTSVTSPIGQQWTYAYDAGGNLTQVVDAAGNSTPAAGDGTTTYTYDAMNRLTAIDYSDATPDVSFTYDGASNRTQMTDGAGTETYTYDDLDRLSALTRGPDTFSYAYDAASNLRSRTYPTGTLITFGYDDDARLAAVTADIGTTTYAYDAAANLTQADPPNGTREARTYDRAGRLTEVRTTRGADTLSFSTYTLDAVGNPTAVVTPEGTTIYVYDALNRLTEACLPPGCVGGLGNFIRYAYDPVGNRLSETRPLGATTYTYNDADQLTMATGLLGATPYAYDPNGNQIQAGPRTFTHDLANRLTSTTAGGVTITYSYDGDGKRLQASTTGGPVTNYLWDPNAALPTLAIERDGTGGLIRRYVHGADLIAMTSGGAPFYYHHDGLGSVVALTDGAGALQWTYAYEPFGTTRTENQQSLTAPVNLMRFTGEFLDRDTGLYHLRARQYDPGTGRFLRTDPLAPALTDPYVSAYVYANNRPTVLVDPSGLRWDDGEGGWFKVWKAGWDALPTWAKVAIGAGVAVPAAALCLLSPCAPAAAAAASPIATRLERLMHVLERHYPGGSLATANKSVFLSNVNVVSLVRAAQSVPAVQQVGGNFQRIVDAGRIIGLDRNTGLPTSIYTVITNAAGSLVTAFPGTPTR